MPRPFRLLGAVLLGATLLGTGCSDLPVGVYRIDVQQGNVLDETMLARLSPGMEKRKVRFVLGTPMLIDTFNQDRWDYVFTYSRRGGRIEQRQITLFFEDELLVRIEGDVHQGEGTRENTRGETLVLVPEEQRSEGFLDTVVPSFDFLRPDPEESPGRPQPSAAGEEAEGTEEADVEVSGPEESDAGDGELARAAPGPESGPPLPSAPGEADDEEEEEGWFGNLLQYLREATPASPAKDPEPSSPSGAAQSRQ